MGGIDQRDSGVCPIQIQDVWDLFKSKISLLCKSEIRFEGILFNLDLQDSTITLANVKSFGTEDRPTKRPVPPIDEAFEFIIFRRIDIKRIDVLGLPKAAPTLTRGLVNDPAVVRVSHYHSSGQPSQGGQVDLQSGYQPRGRGYSPQRIIQAQMSPKVIFNDTNDFDKADKDQQHVFSKLKVTHSTIKEKKEGLEPEDGVDANNQHKASDCATPSHKRRRSSNDDVDPLLTTNQSSFKRRLLSFTPIKSNFDLKFELDIDDFVDLIDASYVPDQNIDHKLFRQNADVDYVEVPHFREVKCYPNTCDDSCDCRIGRKFVFEIEGKEYSNIYEHDSEDILTSSPIASYGEYMDIKQYDNIVRCTANCYSFEDSEGWLHLGFSEEHSLLNILVHRFASIKSDSLTQCGSKWRAFIDLLHNLMLDKVMKVVPCTDRNAAEAVNRMARMFSPTMPTLCNMDFHRPKPHTLRAVKMILVCFAIKNYLLRVPSSEPFILHPVSYPYIVSPLYWKDDIAARQARCTDLVNQIRSSDVLQNGRTNCVGRTKCPIIQNQEDVSPIVDKFAIIRKIVLLESATAKSVDTFFKSAGLTKCLWTGMASNTLTITEILKAEKKMEKWIKDKNFDLTENWDAKLADHQQEKEESKTFLCHFCPTSFASNSGRSGHETTIHKRTNVCEECGKSCPSPSALLRHSQVHSGKVLNLMM